MKVLLLDRRDDFDRFSGERWDLVVDLARAPQECYENWQGKSDCQVMSIYEFARGASDLHELHRLLQPGLGRVIGRFGIDWWDIASIMVAERLQHAILMQRLFDNIPEHSDLHTSRSNSLASTLAQHKNCKLDIRSRGAWHTSAGRVRHYWNSLSRLDSRQIRQIAADKLDVNHSMRRHFGFRRPGPERSEVLVPTAYINVSRTAAKYAEMYPDLQFLFVHGRNSGLLQQVPGNVRTVSLSPFFTASNRDEVHTLNRLWHETRMALCSRETVFQLADASGLLDSVAGLIRWGVAVRDAWDRVLDSHSISACLCADDSNPYTRIPLILSRRRGIPSIACHHGAMDFRMAFKPLEADCYLAKGEMELDYLTRTCGVSSTKIHIAPPRAASAFGDQGSHERAGEWLVWFTEPYETAWWRSEKVYSALLPKLVEVARRCGPKLMLKLHPFESEKYFRRLIRRVLPPSCQDSVLVRAGSLAEKDWGRIRGAVTVESTVAIDCTMRRIPVFLLGWMKHPYTEYQKQYRAFDIGQVLESVKELDRIPALLNNRAFPFANCERLIASETTLHLRQFVARTNAQSAPTQTPASAITYEVVR